MSARAQVTEALERLREAGGRLAKKTTGELHAALADVLEAWRAPGSRWQAELVERLPACTGFSPEAVRRGLALGLAPYGGEAFHELVRSELGGPDAIERFAGPYWQGFETTAAVLGGAIPLPAITAILAPLALRSPVLVKVSAHDPVTAPLFARAIAQRMPELGECVEVVDFRRDDGEALEALCSADCVVATGSDAAVAAIGARVAAPRRFVAHGHRDSVGVIGRLQDGRDLLRAARGLALDVALWDQLGCLSPVAVYVLDDDPRAAGRLADALAAALAALERRMPRGRIAPEAAAAITRERAEAEMRAAAGAAVSLRTGPGTSWTVVCEPADEPRPAPLHRFVRVHPASAAALDALAGAPLAAAAVDGSASEAAGFAWRLLRAGASRVCLPGRLQTPPLSWPRGGLGVLVPLARRVGAELDGPAR